MLAKRLRHLRATFPVAALQRPGLGRTLVTAMIGSFGVRFAGMALTFFVGVLLARMLGPVQFGIYGLVMSLAAMLAIPAQLGLPQLITREMASAEARGDAASLYNIVVWFTLIILVTSAVAVLAGLAGYHLWPGNYEAGFAATFVWGLGTVPVIALIALGMGALRGMHRVVSAQAYDALLRPALLLAMLLILTALDRRVDSATALLLQCLTGAAAAVICICHIAWLLRTRAQVRIGRFDRSWPVSAAPMAGTEMLRVLDGQYPVLLLGVLAAVDDVGIFRVALGMVGFISLPGTLVNLVVMPHVSQLYAQGDIRRLQRVAGAAALANFSSTAAMTIGIFLLGKPLLALTFGAEFVGAWLPLVLMGVAYCANGFFGSAATILNMCGAERTVMAVHVVGPVLGIALTFLLFPIAGIAAPALAMIAAQLVQGIMMYRAAKARIGLDVSLLALFRGAAGPNGQH